MKTAPIAILKAKLSEYLDAVKAGEEIIVTERGQPVARISPIAASQIWDARLEHLIASGAARPPLAPLPQDFWTRPRPADPEGRALDALMEERRTGR
ncbi:MAG: type II toxin-antitoxin system Phd/YefM family antitoxin [bacterium]